jgi:hypothetical protein
MATYAELLQASENEALNKRVRVACVVAAEIVRGEQASVPNHANRLVWAKSVFSNPDDAARKMLWVVLAQNRTYGLNEITTAEDAAVQTAVNAAVDVFATGA